MKLILKIISYLALILIVLAPSLFYAEKIDLIQNKLWMTIATVMWFASSILISWLNRNEAND